MPTKKDIKRDELMTAAHEEYEKGLNVHAFFKIHNNDLGEDLVQDTFMKTWKYLVKGGKIEQMKAFLYHILNNLIIDEYRKRKTSSLDDLLDKGFEIGFDEIEKNTNIADGKAALLLINFLPKKDQEIIKMRYIQELSITEISEITKQTKNTIAVQIHRGMNKLKVLYRE
jgi:RNA polymerase sigma-70 factor (ECF subfamily)